MELKILKNEERMMNMVMFFLWGILVPVAAFIFVLFFLGGSMIDAEALEVKEGNFLQSGSSKCHVNVEDRMRVNLTGGCMLTFKRTPRIEVERIVNSTLIKADDPKRK